MKAKIFFLLSFLLSLSIVAAGCVGVVPSGGYGSGGGVFYGGVPGVLSGQPGTHNFNFSNTGEIGPNLASTSKAATLANAVVAGGAIAAGTHITLKAIESRKPAQQGPTATYAVVPGNFDGPPVERGYWRSRDPRDREIEEMLDRSRFLEQKADAIERLTDAEIDLEKARQYREARRPVAAVRPVSNGDKKLEEHERKLDMLFERLSQPQEQKIAPAPATPLEKEVPLEEVRPERTFEWEKHNPQLPNVVLVGGLTPGEKEFFRGRDGIWEETGPVLGYDRKGNPVRALRKVK